jgi:hypothetical protein
MSATRTRFGLRALRGEALQQQAGAVVEADGKEHQQDIDWLAPAVEHQVDREEPDVAPPAGHEVVDRQDDGR